MKSSRPRVLLTGPASHGEAMWQFSRAVIEFSGGEAVRFKAAEHSASSFPQFDALIIGGGEDIDPALYGEKPLPGINSKFDRYVDDVELSLLKHALDLKVPVLGICRGMQIINVFFGGTLHQDISGFYPQKKVKESRLPFKFATLDNHSQLAKTIDTIKLPINAMHTQAVKDLGSDLKAVAWEKAGLVLGLEKPSGSPLIGVQWHPEFLPYLSAQRRLYRWLLSHSSP